MINMKKIHMVLGGNLADTFLLEDYQKDDFLIGVDRGALHLIESGYAIDLAIGDFDSVSSEEFTSIAKKSKQLKEFASEKDETDTELAIHWIKENYPHTPVKIYGWSGGRVDHLLHLVYLIYQPNLQEIILNIEWISPSNRAKFYLPGHYQIKNDPNYLYFSIITMTPVKNLKIEEAKYNLPATHFNYPKAFISNEFVQDYFKLSFDEGLVFFLRTIDKNENK